MSTVKAKAFRVNDASRAILQCFFDEEIPQECKYVLASSKGYLFLEDEIGEVGLTGAIRFPRYSIVSYFDIEYEA